MDPQRHHHHRSGRHLPTLLRLAPGHQVDTDRFITHHFTMDQFDEGYDVFARPLTPACPRSSSPGPDRSRYGVGAANAVGVLWGLGFVGVIAVGARRSGLGGPGGMSCCAVGCSYGCQGVFVGLRVGLDGGEDWAGDVVLEAANGVFLRLARGGAPCGVGAGGGVPAEPTQHDAVEGGVGGAVTATRTRIRCFNAPRTPRNDPTTSPRPADPPR